jgi:flavodoxin
MKVAIAYYSRHHGNTRKLLDAIRDSADVELIDVEECKEADLSGYDIIGFASGIYFGRFSRDVADFARSSLPDRKRVFLIHTYGMKMRRYTKEMEKIFEGKSCQLLGIYGCKGYDTFGPFKLFGGVAKGHPDENDVKGAVEFFREIIRE